MLSIENKTVARLRDRLRDRGQRSSLFASDLSLMRGADDINQVPVDVLLRFDALCETMYLMAAADGRLDPVEEDTLRGAIRELSEGTVRSVHIRSMMEEAGQRLAKDGVAGRVRAIAERLRVEPTQADAAFVLAAVIAFADNEIADEENALLNELAEALGIDEARANELLDEFEVGPSVPTQDTSA